jgi:hypothetical protein
MTTHAVGHDKEVLVLSQLFVVEIILVSAANLSDVGLTKKSDFHIKLFRSFRTLPLKADYELLAHHLCRVK